MSIKDTLTKERLEDLYINKHFTYQEIADIYEITRAYVSKLIKEYNIDTSKGERFTIECDQCHKPFEIYRKRFRSSSLNYCSTGCYQAHRVSLSGYKPSRQGQRIARAVMASHLGRDLLTSEVVHHLDGDDMNNDINNLLLFVSQSEHLRFHHQIRINPDLAWNPERLQSFQA